MKDIDFDELDRAVSSLMGSVPKDGDKQEATDPVAEPSMQPSNEAVLDQAESEPVVALDTPSVDESQAMEAGAGTVAAADPVEPEQAAPLSAPSIRRGRFMDVKPAGARDSSRPAPSRAVSRQAPSLRPVSGETMEQPEQPSDDEPMLNMPDSTNQPDPIDMQPDTGVDSEIGDSELLASAKEQVDSILSETSQLPTEEPLDDAAPLDSPFLPGAKVDKRPLGRPAEPAPVVDIASELAEDTSGAPVATETPQGLSDDISPNKDAQLPEQPLPAELSSDLLSIETDTGTSALSAPYAAEPSPEASQPQPVAQPTVQPTPVASPRPATPVSIPQQYKVEPKKNEESQATSAIYDAQPLSHPAKKTPGWVWVVAIVGIIILGVAGGVAVYYFVMS